MSLKIEFDREDLRPLVHLAVAEALGRMEEERAKLNSRLAYTEPEAAVLLGVKPHVLRDCRRRGELQGAKLGSRIVYTRADLLDFLDRQKENL
jgi:hypothetical protein